MTIEKNITEKQLLKRLFEWWCNPSSLETENEMLSPDFIYDRGMISKGGDWVWMVKQAQPWRDLRILDSIVAENQGVLVFEGIDSATELKHRICWVIKIINGRIARILSTSEMVAYM